MDVSIIIVNYKTPELLLACVKSVYKYVTGCSFEVIVIDNKSEDNSKELLLSRYSQVQWIDMGCNVGFGRANNKGILKGKGEYTLLLNSDTEFYEDALTKTLNYYKELEKKGNVGFVGCQVMYSDRKLQPSCNYYWAGIREAIEEHPIGIKILQHWLRLKKLRSINKFNKLNHNHEITWLGIPFALIKSKVIKQNLFDPRFFMYSEDEELNFRLAKKGFKHFYFSKTGIFHYMGASSSNNEIRQRQILFSKLLFILISRGRIYFNIYTFVLKSTYRWNKRLNKNEIVGDIRLEEGVKIVKKSFDQNICLNFYSN